jgi:acetylornithine deacetylase/succinyl-diaminopimelate desuccinylase-like protein
MMKHSMALMALLLSVASVSHAAEDRAEFRDIFRELVETNTTHSVGSCTQASERMQKRLKGAGFADEDLHLVVAPDHPKDGSLVAEIAGSNKSEKAVLLLAHLDVVEAKREDWTRDPFKLTEEGGYFYGRGTFDDKAMAAAWVDILLRLHRGGFKPKRTIKMALTCGEEGGATFNGVEYLLKTDRPLIDAAFALNEFAWGELDANGKRIDMLVQVGEKTSVDYTLEVTNRGGHSSRPVKVNAIYSLAAGLTKLSDFSFPVRLNDTTRAYFSQMAGIAGGERGEAMRAIVKDPNDAKAAATLSQDVNLNAILHTTCVATLLSAGHATNALPQRASANVNCRLFPGDDAETVRQTLTRVVDDPSIKVTLAAPADPTLEPPPLTAAIMKPIEKVTQEFYPGVPVVPILQAAGTDAIYLTPAGIPTYGMSGMFLDPDLSNVHGQNERIHVDSLYQGGDFLYALVKDYAAH